MRGAKKLLVKNNYTVDHIYSYNEQCFCGNVKHKGMMGAQDARDLTKTLCCKSVTGVCFTQIKIHTKLNKYARMIDN